MPRAATSSYVLTIPLKTTPHDAKYLLQEFETARQLYNALLNIAENRFKDMSRTKEYKDIKFALYLLRGKNSKESVQKRKDLNQALGCLVSKYCLNHHSLEVDATQLRTKFLLPSDERYKKNGDEKKSPYRLDSDITSKLAARVETSIKQRVFYHGKKHHYKKYDEMHSIEGKRADQTFLFKDGILKYKNLSIEAIIRTDYERECLKSKVKYCRILKKEIRGQVKFYVQVILEGIPPTKMMKGTNEPKHPLGKGNVGIDIGTQTIAIASEKEVLFAILADKVNVLEIREKQIQKYMDRSRRATNPDNFYPNGTIRRISKDFPKREWKNSNRYFKAKAELKEVQRKQAAIRRLQHEIMANKIMSMGDTHFVEKMNFKALQRRAKKTTKRANGKFNKKKRFGKSLKNRAPAMLLTILDRKLHRHGKSLQKVNTYETKASQYDHISDTYKKKELSDRWATIGDGTNQHSIQRDLYSSFLLMNIALSNEGQHYIDRSSCLKTFSSFKPLHDQEIKRLKSIPTLASMGV